MSDFGADLDLLGDPVPEGFGRRGRPPHVPTPDKRTKVLLCLAQGWPNGRIARALGITEPTLRKHYFRELKVRDEARDRLEATRLHRLWSMGREGNVAALKEFGRIMERQDADEARRRFDEETEAGVVAETARRKLGKKEAAQLEAQSAGHGTDWGSDLLGPDECPTQH